MPLKKILKKRFGGFDQIAGDLWGGFAAMLMALPAAIAYGIAVMRCWDRNMSPMVPSPASSALLPSA